MGQACSLGEKTGTAYNILVEKQLGRPRRMCEDSTTLDFKKNYFKDGRRMEMD
jgi:hypothetical protein